MIYLINGMVKNLFLFFFLIPSALKKYKFSENYFGTEYYEIKNTLITLGYIHLSDVYVRIDYILFVQRNFVLFKF